MLCNLAQLLLTVARSTLGDEASNEAAGAGATGRILAPIHLDNSKATVNSRFDVFMQYNWRIDRKIRENRVGHSEFRIGMCVAAFPSASAIR